MTLNIAAFLVNNNTRKYIYDVFSALMMPWEYVPDDNQITSYRNTYIEDGHSNACIKVFDCVTAAARNIIPCRKIYKESKSVLRIVAALANKEVYIYGAGVVGKKAYEMFRDYCNIKGFIVSDSERHSVENVHYISEVITEIGENIVFVAVSERHMEIIKDEFNKYAVKNVVYITPSLVRFLLEYQ